MPAHVLRAIRRVRNSVLFGVAFGLFACSNDDGATAPADRIHAVYTLTSIDVEGLGPYTRIAVGPDDQVYLFGYHPMAVLSDAGEVSPYPIKSFWSLGLWTDADYLTPPFTHSISFNTDGSKLMTMSAYVRLDDIMSTRGAIAIEKDGSYSFLYNPANTWFGGPTGCIVQTSSGAIFVTEGSRITKFEDNTLYPFAGAGPGYSDNSNPLFGYISDMVAGNKRNLYIADPDNHCIRQVTPAGNVSTFAGTNESGFVDGPSNLARFKSPKGLAVDDEGNLYVADTGNNAIRKIDLMGNVTTLAGNTTPGTTDGPAPNARFDAPIDVALNSSGEVFVLDWGNKKLRILK